MPVYIEFSHYAAYISKIIIIVVVIKAEHNLTLSNWQVDGRFLTNLFGANCQWETSAWAGPDKTGCWTD